MSIYSFFLSVDSRFLRRHLKLIRHDLTPLWTFHSQRISKNDKNKVELNYLMMTIELMTLTPVHFAIYEFVPITLNELNFDNDLKHVSFTAIFLISDFAYQLQPLNFPIFISFFMDVKFYVIEYRRPHCCMWFRS